MASELDKKRNDPSTLSMAYMHMAPKWHMMSTLLGGTATMRAAGQAYLPPHPHETDKNYRERLNATVLYNMTELTLDSLVGKPFSDHTQVQGAPPELQGEKFLDDVDMQGRDLHRFCRAWFREGLAKSFAHVLVDMPTITDTTNRTLADDRAENNRPYFTLLSPENVIFIEYSKVNGVEVPMHVRIWEQAVERVGYAEVVQNYIRVLEPGMWWLYKEIKDEKTKKVVWRQIDGGLTDLDYIPLVTFYANEDGNMMGKPPLEDLAFMNVAHWQSGSDQRNILTVARFPMLAVSGAHDSPNSDVMVIGPRQLLATRAENGKFYYVEHEGKAIQAGERDLEHLEQQMASYGAEFLRKRPGGGTATARALDSAEATSPLQDMTYAFIDCVEQALKMAADWLNKKFEGKVIIPTDFGPDTAVDADLRVLAEARRNRDLSRDQFIKELKRRGSLADDFDEAANVSELQSEPQIQSPFASGFNTDGSAGSNVDNRAKKPGAETKTTVKKKATTSGKAKAKPKAKSK